MTTPSILDEHLAALHHLNIMILGQRLGRFEIEKRPNTTKNTFHVLSVSFKLVYTYAVVNIFQLFFRVAWRSLLALF